MASRRVKTVLWVLGGGLVALAATIAIASVYVSRHARDWVEAGLEQQFKSDVDLKDFRISVYPELRVDGEDLALHFRGQTAAQKALPPLMSIKHFSVRGSVLNLMRRHVRYVHLEGLAITVPPRGGQTDNGTSDVKKTLGGARGLYFDEIVSENAVLTTLTNKPGKDPLEFVLDHLKLHSVGSQGVLAFQADMVNPTPPGQIISTGTFGPWDTDTPSRTPVSGKYTFDKADLGVFPGIQGILSSAGNYSGYLEEIQADGTVNVPNFRLDRAGHSTNLSTTFKATVDGTNGDTYLHPVEAHMGKATAFTAEGSVEGRAGIKGKTVNLNITMEHARIEDLMLLAIKVAAPMTGPIRVKTKFFLPPGTVPVPDRMVLNGTFALDSVHFTNQAVQQKLDNMSKRSMGQPKQVVDPLAAIKDDDVASAMAGTFRLAGGKFTLSDFGYTMPGADVKLAGAINLADQSLDLHGRLEMEAKLSQTVTGPKSLLLKFADPFFKKNGKGAVVPIKITGPLQHPAYGLDRHRKQEAKN